MAGLGQRIGTYEKTAQTVGVVAFFPGAVLQLDISNSTSLNGHYAQLPSGAGVAPLGVCTDLPRNSVIDGAQEPGQGASYADDGWWYIMSAGAIAVGDKVSVASAEGDVQTQARAAGGAQPVPIVGEAFTATSGADQPVLVRLEIGATW